jgi:NIPSNAP
MKISIAVIAAASFAAGSLATVGFSHLQSVHAASDRVFELRVYHVLPGRLAALQARFRDHTIAIFKRHGMTSVGYWVPQDSPASENTLIYILAHPSRDTANQHWKEFRDDPEWQKVSKESEADGKIVEKVDSTFMTPTDYSAIK